MKLRITILKYHSWYLSQISLQIMLLPILIAHIQPSGRMLDFIALLPGIYQSSSITLESVPRLQSPQLFLKKTKKGE